MANVYHADLWGVRSHKYEWLREQELCSTRWNDVSLSSPSYLFVPQDKLLRAEYEQGWKISEVMNEYGDPAPGIVTTQDQFAISWSADESGQKIRRFLETQSEAEARSIWKLCSQSQWNYERAKFELPENDWMQQINPILYRPFDVRWTVYNRNVAVHRRERVSHHMLAGSNLGLSTTRALETGSGWKHIFCLQNLMVHHSVSLKEGNYLFPLYLYPTDTLFDAGRKNREPNLAPAFLENLSEAIGLQFVPDGQGDLVQTFGPEDVFNYAYGVFHSPTYRQRYVEFLKRDFPRLPLTSSRALFSDLCALGEELAALHLMRSPLLDDPFTTFPKSGSNIMEKAKYDPDENRVYINKEGQYFDNVPGKAWNFRIGGYHVLDKWLKDRRGRKLSDDELEHYQKIVVALKETSRLMSEIDEVIDAHGGWPLTGSVMMENEENGSSAEAPRQEAVLTSKPLESAEKPTGLDDAVPNAKEPHRETHDSEHPLSVDEISPTELSAALQECVPEREGIDRESLLHAAARRLGYEKPNRRLRKRLNRTISADNKAGRLRTDWEQVWKPKKRRKRR